MANFPFTSERAAKFETIAFTLLRIVVPFVIWQHGVQKLFGMFGGMGPSHGPVPTYSIFWFAGLIETFLAPLVALGLFTRPLAILVSGEMATAYFMMHLPHGFWPILNHGELPMLFCFSFLYIAAHGPGPYSLDALIARRSTTR